MLHFGGISPQTVVSSKLSIAVLGEVDRDYISDNLERMVLNVFSDEDLAGDHLLAETTQSLQKLLQTPKKLHLPLERPNLKVT